MPASRKSAAEPAPEPAAPAKKKSAAAKKSAAPEKTGKPAAPEEAAAPESTPAPKKAAARKAPTQAANRSTEKPAAAEPAPAGETTDTTAEPVESVPMNRAERRAAARAKGKGGAQSQPHGSQRVVGGTGPAHTHRMWANRRSGG